MIQWLALTFGLYISLLEGAELLQPPLSITVQFNQQASFLCVGNGTRIFWILHGTLLNSPDQEKGVTITDLAAVPGLLSSKLTINITELPFSYDVISQGIGASCQIVSEDPFDEVFSDTAMLLVTGFRVILIDLGISPPQDISLFANWTLTWSDQFYRPRDALLYNQTFVITVNGKMIMENTTNTSVQLRPFCTRPTEVNITAYIGSYHSSTSVLFENVIEKRSIEIINYTTSVNGTECSITLNILVDTQFCDTRVSGQLRTSEGGVKNYPPLSINPSNESVFTSYNMTGLRNCVPYVAYVNVLNGSNFTEDTDNIAIDPLNSDVKDIEINENEDGSINVQCVYSNISSAIGCHVMFTHTTTGNSRSFNIIGSYDKTMNLSSSGVYAIAIYSINDDGSIAPWTCVPPKQVNVTLVTTPSSNGGSSTVSFVSSSTKTPIPSPSVTVETESESSSVVVSPSTASTFSSNKPTGTTKDTDAYIIGGTFAATVIALIIIIVVVLVVKKNCKQKKPKKKKFEEEPQVKVEAEKEPGAIPLKPVTQKANFALEDTVDQEDPAIRSENDCNGTTRDPIVSLDTPRLVTEEDPVSHNKFEKEPVAYDFTIASSSPSCNDGPLTVVPTHEPRFTQILHDENGARSTFAIDNVDSNEQMKDVKEPPN